MRSQLNELCNNKYDNGMQHFLFPPTGALARVCSLSQHESNSPIPSPPTLFIQIYSRFHPKFALARPVDRGSKDDREAGREED